MKQLRRIPLFKRLPKFHLARREDDLVKPEKRNKYPAFAEDFKTLDTDLIPFFRDLDNEALRSQNAYRRMYIILILCSALATILGIAQIAFIDTSWIVIAGSILVLLLGGVTTSLRRSKYQKRYLNARLAAERLRSEYFLYLGRFGPYANDQDRIKNLREHVADIKAKGEAL